mmetsp:Transcript_13927/g.43690  ORF Transcript_13927/g.43690 Transcript_13927/m.43690 type:complete len:146 (-) Transcript_13927:333-770(-)
MSVVKVDSDHGVETVYMGENGPHLRCTDGSLVPYNHSPEMFSIGYHPGDHGGRRWHEMTSTEKQVLLNIVAKRNGAMMDLANQSKKGTAPSSDGQKEAPAVEAAPRAAPILRRVSRRSPCFTGVMLPDNHGSRAGKKQWWDGQPA